MPTVTYVWNTEPFMFRVLDIAGDLKEVALSQEPKASLEPRKPCNCDYAHVFRGKHQPWCSHYGAHKEELLF